MEQTELSKREKLRAIIEANKISRLPRNKQDEMLENFTKQRKKAKGKNKERLDVIINIVTEKQEQQDEAYFNQTLPEYGGGYENGGGCNVGDG